MLSITLQLIFAVNPMRQGPQYDHFMDEETKASQQGRSKIRATAQPPEAGASTAGNREKEEPAGEIQGPRASSL